MKKLQIAYFGTPDFSARFLEKLLTDPGIPVEVKLVVTQPDRKVGRGQIMQAAPVKEIALKHNLPIATLLNGQIVDENNVTTDQFNNVDTGLVYAFGQMIPESLLNIPHHGFWNIHPSLLPKYRGASPMAAPLIAGDRETGVTLIKMDEELDHGPIIAQETIEIGPKDRRSDLERKLTELGYEMFKKSVHALTSSRVNELKLQEQNHSKATHTKRLTKQDGRVEMSKIKAQMSKSPEKLFNLFRGLYPWPGVWSKINVNGVEKRLKITDMDLVDGKLQIKKVQLEGKREVDFITFNRAYNVF